MQVGTGPNEKQQAPTAPQQAPTAPQQAYPPYGAAPQPTVFVVQQPPPMMYQPPPPAQDASLCLIIAAIVIGIIAFLVSGIGLVALIFAICGAINKNTCLCITAIIIGAVCILLAIAFWIAFAIIISRKVALENKYCQTLKTACCSGTYIASNSYKQFACSLENSCWADPFSYTVYAICKGSFSGTISGLYCSGTSRCEGTAVDQTSAVCSLCSITGSCSLSSYYSSDISSSGNYCK